MSECFIFGFSVFPAFVEKHPDVGIELLFPRVGLFLLNIPERLGEDTVHHFKKACVCEGYHLLTLGIATLSVF